MYTQWAREGQNRTMDKWKKVTLFHESYFLLDPVDGLVCVHCLPGEDTAPECTMGRRKASRNMLWVMFFWENLNAGIHVDVTLTCTTYLNIVADQVHSFIAPVVPDGSDFF